MMLCVVQHGEALPETVDPEKGLSATGTQDVQALARACAEFGVSAREIIHSGKKRACQSAAILREVLGIRSRVSAGLDPLDPAKPVAAECEKWEDPAAVTFQRGGMICLEKRCPGEWSAAWTVFPRQPGSSRGSTAAAGSTARPRGE